MRKRRSLKAAVVTSFCVAFLPAGALCDQVRLPPPPITASAAAASFDARATIITRYNACGRELDYSTYRREQLNENYEHQGEGLSGILIAKIAWLTDPRFLALPCEYRITIPRPRNPDGSFVHPTAEVFLIETLGAWFDASTPTRCSFPTSQVDASETEVKIVFQIDRDCLRWQVNEAIRAMVKDGQMGTEELPCFSTFSFTNKGDFDVNVRDLVRIHYMGTLPRWEVLERSTIDHMYENLLAARGDLSDATYSLLTDCDDPAGDELGSPEDFADREDWYRELIEAVSSVFQWLAEFFFKVVGTALVSVSGVAGAPFLIAAGEDPTGLAAPHYDLRVPETENHRLMIEVSKYLTNAKIIQELEHIGHDNVDEIRQKQHRVGNWLLSTLQRIAIGDFDEYNSRPYTRYSLNAILNLYDFAGDPRLRTASRIVLDLSAAKFAAASNRARRIVPFRRLSNHDGNALYEMVSGADHEIARAIVLAGQTQLLPAGVDPGAASNMVYAAVSSYRAPRPVLEVTIERSQPFEQDVRHAGIEGYYASPAFTMSLGGVRRPAALSFLGFERDVDRGVAMPTVIIPTAAGHSLNDLFAMRGNGSQHHRTDNLCGWHGFICGIQPTLSAAFSNCTTGTVTSNGPDYFFVNSAGCPEGGAGPPFYLAFKRGNCSGGFCEAGRRYGLMEIVEAPKARPSPDPDFEAFKLERQAALEAAGPDGNGFGIYVTADGDSIRYHVHDRGSSVLEINGTPRRGFATRGDVINAEGNGRAAIASPWSTAKVIIDYSDWANPKRTEVP